MSDVTTGVPKSAYKRNRYAAASFTLGIIGIVDLMVSFVDIHYTVVAIFMQTFLMAIVGILLSLVGGPFKRNETSQGLAISGLVTSYIALILSIILGGVILGLFSKPLDPSTPLQWLIVVGLAISGLALILGVFFGIEALISAARPPKEPEMAHVQAKVADGTTPDDQGKMP